MSLEDRRELSKFDASKTKQEFKKECDVNHIMKKFKKVMGVDFLSRYQGYVGGDFGDFSEVVDYRTALDQINQAREVFMALPAKVRARFENDTAQFLDFVHDPKNASEMVSMGLAVDRPVAATSAAGSTPPIKG